MASQPHPPPPPPHSSSPSPPLRPFAPYRLLSTASSLLTDATTATAKPSLRSHSSSFEADDEHSSSSGARSLSAAYDGHDDEMGPPDAAGGDGRGDGHTSQAPQYVGEDTRLTSRKELAGWYAYGFAAEVFIICGMGSFIPITLEQLARENGVLLSDHRTPCGSSSSSPGNSTSFSISSSPSPAFSLTTRGGSNDEAQCIITLLGHDINTASFAMYTFSISVLVQSLLVISISCAADHGNYRKRLLLGFAFAGATATMLFLPVTSGVYLLAALCAIISNTCCGASFVLLNSFLPLLVRHHPRAQEVEERQAERDGEDGEDGDDGLDGDADGDGALLNSTAALLPSAAGSSGGHARADEEKNVTSIELELSTQISSTGIGIGYSAGLFVQCFSIIIIVVMQSSTFSLRLILFLIGLWWFTFTVPAALWLRPRPGPPLPKHPSSVRGSNQEAAGKTRTWLGYIAQSWMSLFRTMRLARRLTDIVLFLGAWFLLSDAIATVSGVSILFAKTHLLMPPPQLALISVLATMAGILGAFTWPLLSRTLDIKPVNTILCCIALFEFIPLYGLLDYIPFIHEWGYLGLQQPWEMYPLGILYGFVLGGLSSYCRSLYGELIPPGSEAAFYALYAITDKGSSIFGPAIVGLIVDRTGGIRPAFWFLVLLIGLPAPLVWFVDVDRGRREGRALAEQIEGFKARDREGGAAGADEAGDLLAGLDD